MASTDPSAGDGTQHGVAGELALGGQGPRSPKISVIVPVYNAASTLDRCVRSVLAQDLLSLECILIDDGSTDGSGPLCDAWASSDPRVVVVHQTNSGVSAARNAGIEASAGDYLQFVDSDDYIEPSMGGRLSSLADLHGCDMVLCGFYAVNAVSGRTREYGVPMTSSLLSPSNFLDRVGQLMEASLLNSPCNKLFKAELVRSSEVRFSPDWQLGEDLLFNIDMIRHYKSVYVLNEPLYWYMVGMASPSLSRRYEPKRYALQREALRRFEQVSADVGADPLVMHRYELAYARKLLMVTAPHFARGRAAKGVAWSRERVEEIGRDPVLANMSSRDVHQFPVGARITFLLLRGRAYRTISLTVALLDGLRESKRLAGEAVRRVLSAHRGTHSM